MFHWQKLKWWHIFSVSNENYTSFADQFHASITNGVENWGSCGYCLHTQHKSCQYFSEFLVLIPIITMECSLQAIVVSWDWWLYMNAKRKVPLLSCMLLLAIYTYFSEINKLFGTNCTCHNYFLINCEAHSNTKAQSINIYTF